MAKRKILPTPPAGRAVRGRRKRAAKTPEPAGLSDLVEDEAGDDDDDGSDRGSPSNVFGYYLQDVDKAPALLTKREELQLGRVIAHRAVDLVRQRLDVAATILKLARRGKLSATHVPLAKAFAKDFNPKGLKGESLTDHLLGLFFHRNTKACAETQRKQGFMFRLVEEDREGAGAMRLFAEANLRLVIVVAKRYNRGGLSFPELVQEGNLGLLHAIPRFDYRRGLRFSTFATWWIRHAISRALADKARTVRMPVHMTEATYKLDKARNALTMELGRPPTIEELAKRTGNSIDKLDKMRVWMQSPVSLDKPIGEDQDDTLGSYISYDDPEETVLATLVPEKEFRLLLEALKELSPIERDILTKRFGLADDEELTFREIGDQYNLSRERIRQIQNSGLEKLHRRLRLQYAAAI